MELIGHQGDVAFFRSTETPAVGLIEDAQTKAGILAAGTGSGHAHQVDDLSAVRIRKDPATGLIYLEVTARVSISHGRAHGFGGKEADHDYHNPVFLDPGFYIAGIVEETDWITKTVRKVID